MSTPAPGQVTELLVAWRRGDESAAERLIPLVYDDLRARAAGALRRERRAHTLTPTALVHEAYLRLISQQQVDWRNRAQFLGLAAIVMRRVLVNHARDRAAAKRGGGLVPDSLSIVGDLPAQAPLDVLALDQALDRLAAIDARKSRVVELRFFGGLTTEETAEAVGVSVASVERDWTFARAWLYDQLAS